MKKLIIVFTVLLFLLVASFPLFAAEKRDNFDVSIGLGFMSHISNFEFDVYNGPLSPLRAHKAFEDFGVTSQPTLKLFTELEFFNLIILDCGVYMPLKHSHIGPEHFASLHLDYNWIDVNLGLKKEFKKFYVYGKGGLNYSFNWNVWLETKEGVKYLNDMYPGMFPEKITGSIDANPRFGLQFSLGMQYKLNKKGNIRAFSEVGYLRIYSELDGMTINLKGNGYDETIEYEFYNPGYGHDRPELDFAGMTIMVGVLTEFGRRF